MNCSHLLALCLATVGCGGVTNGSDVSLQHDVQGSDAGRDAPTPIDAASDDALGTDGSALGSDAAAMDLLVGRWVLMGVAGDATSAYTFEFTASGTFTITRSTTYGPNSPNAGCVVAYVDAGTYTATGTMITTVLTSTTSSSTGCVDPAQNQAATTSTSVGNPPASFSYQVSGTTLKMVINGMTVIFMRVV